MVRSNTQTFGSESVGSGAVMAGVFGIEGSSAPVAATLMGGDVANETGRQYSKGTGVQAFKGKAEDIISGLRKSSCGNCCVDFSHACIIRLGTFRRIFRFPLPCIIRLQIYIVTRNRDHSCMS